MAGLQEEIKQTKPFGSKHEEVYLNLMRTAEVLQWAVIEVLKPYELSPSQYNVLRILRGAGDNGLKCSEISERLITKDSDITRLLDRLDARELIKRRRDRQDRRVVNVCIAEKGLHLLGELDEPALESSRRAFAHFDSEQLEQLNQLLVLARQTNV